MTTITLPRKLIEDALESFADLVDGTSYINEDDEIGHRSCCGELSYRSHDKTCRAFNRLSALRAALATCTENDEKCTHPENVYRKGEKVYALGDVIDAERKRIEQNQMRSEALTYKYKPDWSAS